MSREIKFRAWADDIMFQPSRITFASSVVYCYDPENDYDFQIEPKYLMQYTGLKDKNGVEIYEGDIITDRWGSKHEVAIGPIYHADHEDSFAGFGFGIATHQPEDFERYVEVIGNIYENKELLK